MDADKKRLAKKIALFATFGCIGLAVLLGLQSMRKAYLFSKLARPLVSAVEAGDEPEARRLLNSGADPNTRKLKDRAKDVDILQFFKSFFSHHARLTAPTVLVRACQENSTPIAKLLLERGADVDPLEIDGQTPLSAAAANSNAELVHILLERGAHPNRQEPNGMIALIYGAGSQAIVQDLIKHGANVTLRTKTGFSALKAAIKPNNVDTVKLLVQAGADPTEANLLDYSIRVNESDPEIMHFLISHGAKITSVDKDGRTPLFNAYSEDFDLSVAQQLIAAGVDVNHRDKSGQTALMHVVGNVDYDGQPGNSEMVALLLKSGADPTIKDNNNHNALWHASTGLSNGEMHTEERDDIIRALKAAMSTFKRH